jgi:hypothetical protein
MLSQTGSVQGQVDTQGLLASAREVIENPTDDIGIFDAGDDVHGMDCSYNPFAFPTSL